MKTLVAFPSTAIFGQQVAIALAERDALAAFMTVFAWDRESVAARLLAAAPPPGPRIARELGRRSVSIPGGTIETAPLWEIVRTVAQKLGASTPHVDRIWDHMSRAFTRRAARRLRRGDVRAVYAYEYTALEAFAAADRHGVAKILDFPSLNSRAFEAIQREQRARYPELRSADDAYFDALFEVRQARRDAEMAAADVIITNSSVSHASHVAAGADPARLFAVPYGAPPVRTDPVIAPSKSPRLRVVWAGTFSIRKGAHLLVEAWRTARLDRLAELDIYGAMALPERLFHPMPPGITFHGSVVQDTLFAAFDHADVLIFPTLSDGFGMVVTEAFARAMPVIATDQAGASDLIRHGENGLIIPAGSQEAIADALRWCADHRTELAAMRHSALETARGWQWPDYRAALIAALDTGLSRAGHRAITG